MYDVSLDLYKIFCTVARTGSMSLAANELFITQPAVSMAVRQLEEKLGKPLFIRQPKGIKTTAEGTILYEYLSQALGLIETAEKKYAALVNRELGEIRIGAGDTILAGYLITFIETFNKNFPGISIKITNRTTDDTIALLRSGLVDLGFVNLPVDDHKGLTITQCMEINDCIIGGKGFESLRKGIRLDQLNDYPLMLLERDSNSRRRFDDFALKNGVILNPNIELGSSDLLVRFVKINLGLACVTRQLTKEIDNESIFEIPLTPKIPKRSIGLIKLKGVTLSSAASSFLEVMGLGDA